MLALGCGTAPPPRATPGFLVYTAAGADLRTHFVGVGPAVPFLRDGLLSLVRDYYLGLIAERRGDLAAARSFYRQSLRARPHATVQQRLDALGR